MTRMESGKRKDRRAWERITSVLLSVVVAAVLVSPVVCSDHESELDVGMMKPISREKAEEIKANAPKETLMFVTLEYVRPGFQYVSDAPLETGQPKDEEASIDEETAELPYTEEEVDALAQTVWGEAYITKSDMEMAAVAWCVLNRVDSENPYYPDTIMENITKPGQFCGYSDSNPIDDHVRWLVLDVLDRWMEEKAGSEEVGRVLPPEYMFFHGTGLENLFRIEYEDTGAYWNWSLSNPYES